MAERTPESIGQDAGQAIADSIIDAMESSVFGLADAIHTMREDQATARETMFALQQRVDAVEQIVNALSHRLA